MFGHVYDLMDINIFSLACFVNDFYVFTLEYFIQIDDVEFLLVMFIVHVMFILMHFL